MVHNQESESSQVVDASVKNRSINRVPLMITGLLILVIGIAIGYFLAGNRNKALTSLDQQMPQIAPIKEEPVYESDWATISFRNVNNSKHNGDLYFTYIDTSGKHSLLFMPHVSLEYWPFNIMYNGNRFVYEISEGGTGYFISNARPPFNVKELKVPYNSTIIGWIDDKTILYKEVSNSDPKNQKTTYWIAPVNNVENAQQTSFK